MEQIIPSMEVPIANSFNQETQETRQINDIVMSRGNNEAGIALDSAIREEVEIMCELAVSPLEESSEIDMDHDNAQESNVSVNTSIESINPNEVNIPENAVEHLRELQDEDNAMEDSSDVNNENGFALEPSADQRNAQLHNGTESVMENQQEGLNANSLGQSISELESMDTPVAPLQRSDSSDDIMEEQQAVNDENVSELEDLVESPVQVIQLSDSDAEDIMEEDREMEENQEERELEDIRYATNGRNWAVDMVFNMYNREVEAAAMERRQNQGQPSDPLHLETPTNNVIQFPYHRLLHIRRALLVIDSNRRARIRQILSDQHDDSVNGEDESSPTLDDETPANQSDDDEIPENAIRFDTNLAAEHSYLGVNMNRVSGVEYLDVNDEYNMMLFLHQHIVYPGEVLPFMISGAIIDADIDPTNGIFGICFPFMRTKRNGPIYGVTCQIYEKGTDERGHTMIKSRALQRFVTTSDTHIEHLEYINDNPRVKHGRVKILPEIFLPEPLNCIDMGSLNRFRDISSMKRQFQRYQAATTSWPAHVYNYYNISSIVEKARESLAQHAIDTMPTDPVQLSFWLARNLHLSEDMMKEIFMNDTVNLRMKIIASTLQDESIFVCRICGNRIANCSELFAMSKHGVQTQYCNSAGYIHETNTVYKVLRNAVSYSGEPSSEFSWFPGYKWHIIVCKMCARHIGWEFKATEPNLLPKSFFGISSASVRVSDRNSEVTIPREVTLQNFMRLARRDMQ